jgi:hypothetical protein
MHPWRGTSGRGRNNKAGKSGCTWRETIWKVAPARQWAPLSAFMHKYPLGCFPAQTSWVNACRWPSDTCLREVFYQRLCLATPLVAMSIFRGVKVTIPHPLPCRPIDSSQVMLVEPPRESNPRLDAHHSRHTPGRIHLSRGAKNTTHLKPCGRNQKDDVESMTQPCTYFGRHPCHFAPTRRARARSNLLFMLSRPSRMPHTSKAPP